MAKWVADNPPFPGRAWAQWIRLMYRDAALLAGARAAARTSWSIWAGSTRTCS